MSDKCPVVGGLFWDDFVGFRCSWLVPAEVLLVTGPDAGMLARGDKALTTRETLRALGWWEGQEHSTWHSKHHLVSLNPAGHQWAGGGAQREQGLPAHPDLLQHLRGLWQGHVYGQEQAGHHPVCASIILYGRCPVVLAARCSEEEEEEEEERRMKRRRMAGQQ